MNLEKGSRYIFPKSKYNQRAIHTYYAFIHWITTLALGQSDWWMKQITLKKYFNNRIWEKIKKEKDKMRRLRCECEKCRKIITGRENEWKPREKSLVMIVDCGLPEYFCLHKKLYRFMPTEFRIVSRLWMFKMSRICLLAIKY